MIQETTQDTFEKIEWTSSMIASTTYTPTNSTLLVEFTNDAVYAYSGITQEEYADFKNAESQGKYFIANIRNKKDYIRHEQS